MQVIFGSRVPDGKPLREWSIDRVRFALRRLRFMVPTAKVRLADANGPRGGIDKYCQIEIQTLGAGTVLVSAQAADWRTALDRSLGRAVVVLKRALQRDRKPARGRAHKLSADGQALAQRAHANAEVHHV